MRIPNRSCPHLDLDGTVPDDGAFRTRHFTGNQRHAEGYCLARRREPARLVMNLPGETELQISIDRNDRLQVLPVVTCLAGGRFLGSNQRDLLLGNAVWPHSPVCPFRRVDAHRARPQLKSPFPLIDIREQPLDADVMNSRG
jgi:hypothetical protein